MNICVYCGSSRDVARKYFETAEELGLAIGQAGYNLVFGGGTCGLMGQVASSAKEAGAQVIGVCPDYFRSLAPAYLDKVEWTQGLRDRKEIMAEHSDAFIALPGGLGTIDEFFDILAPKSLHKHDKPIVLINHDGYYETLAAFLRSVSAEGFMREEYFSLFHMADTVQAAMAYLNDYEPDFEVGDLVW